MNEKVEKNYLNISPSKQNICPARIKTQPMMKYKQLPRTATRYLQFTFRVSQK